MADNMLQIHELVSLGRDLTSTDVLAVDTGALTAKVDYGSLKQEITADSVSTTQFDASAVKFSAAQTLTDAQKAQARNNIDAASSGDVGDLKSAIAQLSVNAILLDSEIPDTVQAVTFDSAGNVSTITHTSGVTVIRTDAFTISASQIVEVRTLSTGESLTLTTDLSTLSTTVAYSAAA